MISEQLTREVRVPAETLERIPTQSPFTGDLRRRILLRAAELVEEKGWTTGPNGMEPDGPYCLLGSVNAAATEFGCGPHWGNMYSYSTAVLSGRTNTKADDESRFFCWNDSRAPVFGRSVGRRLVTRLLRRAAAVEQFSFKEKKK